MNLSTPISDKSRVALYRNYLSNSVIKIEIQFFGVRIVRIVRTHIRTCVRTQYIRIEPRWLNPKVPRAYAHTHVRTHERTHERVRAYARTRSCVCSCVRTNAFVRIRAYARVRTFVRTRAYDRAYARTYVRTHVVLSD